MKLNKGQAIELTGCGYNIKGYITDVKPYGFTFEETLVKGSRVTSKGFYSITTNTLYPEGLSLLDKLIERFRGIL
jgi:hypothetical protein